MGNRLYIANGYKGVVIADHTNRVLPSFVGNRAFDNQGQWFGSINTYKGSALSILFFSDVIGGQTRKFLVTGTASPSPEGKNNAQPPFPIMELFEVTSETLPTRLQRVEIRGNISDWDALPSVAFGLVKTYQHIADGKRFLAHIDGFQEGSVRMNEIPTQYWEVLCEWIPSLSCGTEIPLFNYDPEYFSVWQWKPENIATFPIEGGGIVGGKPQPLVKRGNQETWSQPAIRQLSIPVAGHIFILETRFAIIPTQEFTQLIGSHLLYAHHANVANSSIVTGPVTVNRIDFQKLPFAISGVNATFDVDSQFYIHFAWGNGPGVYREYQLSQSDMGGGVTGYRSINPAYKANIQFPREFSGTIQKKMIKYLVVHGDYVYIFYTASIIGGTPGQTPCITVIDITNRSAPVHKWDVQFPTLINENSPYTVWDGRQQPVKDERYLYVPIGDQGIAILDVSCVHKKHPDLIGTFSSFGTIKYPAEHPQAGQSVVPSVNMAIAAMACVVNSIDPSTENCDPVQPENPDVEEVATIPTYTPEEWKGKVWRGLAVDTAEIVRMSVDRLSGKYLSVREINTRVTDGVVEIECFPHKPEKVGRWASDDALDWNPSINVNNLELSGFWYAESDIESGWNDRLVFSPDNGASWHVVNITPGGNSTILSLLLLIQNNFHDKLESMPGFGNRVITVERQDSDKKIKVTLTPTTGLKFIWTDNPPTGISRSDHERSLRFGQTVFGVNMGGTHSSDINGSVIFDNPCLYYFDAIYGGLLDISRWG